MNKKTFDLIKSLNTHIKNKTYSLKSPRTGFLLKCLDYFIFHGFVKGYLSWCYSSKIRIFLNYLLHSKSFINFIVCISKVNLLFTLKRDYLLVLRRDFPLGSFLVTNTEGLLDDTKFIKKSLHGGQVLTWIM